MKNEQPQRKIIYLHAHILPRLGTFPPSFPKTTLLPGWDLLPAYRTVKRILVSVHENGLKVSLESYR